MRKILSIILTAAMTLSLFAAIPFGASAAASSPAITFDTQAEYGYYSNELGKNSSGAPQETGTAQGKAFKFETIPAGKDASVWASALRIAQKNTDGTVSTFKVSPGKTYNISFKYKNDQYIDDYDWAEIYVKLLFVSPDNGMGNFLNAAGIGPDDWWPRAEPGNISRNATDGWVQYSQSFTVPDWVNPYTNSEVALVLNLAQTRTNVSFWVDDVSIELTGLKGTSIFDFETEEQRTYYADTTTSKSTVTVGNPTDETNYAAKYSTLLTEDCTNAWNDSIRISMTYPDGTLGPVFFEAGAKYNISFKVKAETLDYSISKFYLCYASSSQSGYVLGGSTAPQAYAKKTTIGNWYSVDQMKAGWVSFSYDFTVPTDIEEYNQLALFPVVSDGWKLDNQAVWIDDVSITKKTSVTVHNSSLGDFTISPAYGTNIKDVKLPFPNVKVVNWYSDAARTQVYDGTVGYDNLELWVDIENIVGDFENGYDAAKDGWDGDTFHTEQYAGTVNSTALTNKGQPQGSIDNSSWPPVIKLINSDGSNFYTVANHIYKLSFDMKPVDRSTLNSTGIVTVMKDSHTDGTGTLPSYSLMDQETFDEVPAQTNISSAYSEEGDYYKTFSFTFDGTGNMVYITPWCAGTAVYFDNINIIDLTAQLDVTDSEGNVLASGLDGETVTIPDAADPDFVYYADENGTPVGTTTVIRKDKALTKVNSQIAVTGSAFDRANSTLSFTTRFGGIGYTEANGGVTVNTITVGNTRYFVEDMGLLVAPTANVTGELTLDNLGEAIQISGTSLKYSKNGTDELTITAQITTSKYDRDYTVVGYVKCAGGKVIYSKTRSSIAKSYNAAAGIESVVNSAHIKTFGSANYTLVSNSEFNSAESLSNGWNPWGVVNNPSLTDATKPDCNYYSVESATYVDNGNLVLDLKRTGDNTYDLPELLSKYHFTTGYLEVKAKIADVADLGGAIWLNSVALPDDALTIKPDSTNIYVRPELDIVEFSKISEFYFTLHNWGTPESGEFGENNQIRLKDILSNSAEVSLDLQNYHTYGFERTEDVIRMYVDGTMYYELTYADALATYHTNKKPGDYQYRTEEEVRALFVNPTYIILGTGGAQSLAVDASAISTIDYVRFYK